MLVRHYLCFGFRKLSASTAGASTVGMATDHGWQIFRQHEVEISRHTDPNQLLIPLVAELRKEWDNITNKTEYTATLQDLQSSLREAESLSRQARISQRTVENLQARAATSRASLGVRRACQEWQRTLQLYLDGLRGLVENIRKFQHEQDTPNAIGDPAGNERSRDYTENLLQTTRSRISDSQTYLDERKGWLKAQGLPSRDSHGGELEVEDEDGEGRGDRQRGPAKKSVEAREDEGIKGSQGVGGAAPGAGSGADTPGGEDDDGEDDPRKPAANTGIGGSEDEDEDQDEEKYRNADQVDVSHDEDYISLNDGFLAEIGLQSHGDISDEDLLRGLGDVLQQRRDIFVRSDSSLPYYTDTVVQEQPAPRHESQSQQIFQRPGADQEQSDEPASQAQRRRSPRTHSERHRIADAIPSDDPDDGSDDLDEDDNRSKGPPKSNSKRQASDKGDPGADDGGIRRTKKQRKNEHLKSPSEALQNLDGTEHAEEPALSLQRRKFDREWPIFFPKIPPKHLGLRTTYQELYARLVKVEAWHVLPPEEAESDLEWFGRRVAEAEHPEMHERWKVYEDAMRQREGSAAAETARKDWESILDRVYRSGASPTSSPRVEPSGTPVPSEPLNDAEWLKREAQKLGFGDVDIPGVWTFLCTLHTGGQGCRLTLRTQNAPRMC